MLFFLSLTENKSVPFYTILIMDVPILPLFPCSIALGNLGYQTVSLGLDTGRGRVDHDSQGVQVFETLAGTAERPFALRYDAVLFAQELDSLTSL